MFSSAHNGFSLRHVLTVLVWIVLLGMAIPATFADGFRTNGAPLRLTLAEARNLALARNWDLLAAKSEVDAAVASHWIAREVPNPTLALSVGKISADTSHGNGTMLGNGAFARSYDSLVAVSQLLEIGGKRSARRASAQAGLAAAEARLDDARRLLEVGVAQAYVAVLAADIMVRILDESAAALRHEAQIATTRLQAGDISRVDQTQIEISAGRLELDARRARSDAHGARVQLETLLGDPNPSGEFVPAESLETLRQRTDERLTTALALIARPDVRAAEAQVEQAKSEMKLQRALRVPDPTVSLQYEHQPASEPHTIGLGVSFPLPLWNHNRGNIAAASAARKKAEVVAAKISAAAAAEVAVARNAYETAGSRDEEFTRTLVPRSASVREAVTFAYQKGGASLLDLLSAQRNDNEVRLAAAQAAAEVISARSALVAALALPFMTADKP